MKSAGGNNGDKQQERASAPSRCSARAAVAEPQRQRRPSMVPHARAQPHTHLGKLGVCAQVLFVLKSDFFLPSHTPQRRAPVSPAPAMHHGQEPSCTHAAEEGCRSMGGRPDSSERRASTRGRECGGSGLLRLRPHHRTLSASSCFCSLSLSEEDIFNRVFFNCQSFTF